MSADGQGDLWPRRRSTAKPKRPRAANWFVPYLRVYAACYRCHMPDAIVGRVAAVTKKLDRQYGTVALSAFGRYCAATPADRFNVWRFADGFPAWAGQVRSSTSSPLDIAPGESVDAYMARLAKGPQGRGRS